MSDGPYRSLPMSRGWKRLAEFADNRNFDPADVCKAVIPALEQDWRADVSEPIVDGVRNAFLKQQGDLFGKAGAEHMEALRRSTAGFGVARLLVDCADASLRAGQVGEDALAEVGKNTLLARASRGARQVEEHYYREGEAARGKGVRARIEEGIRNAPFESLAREFLGIGPRAPRPSLKHDGLDDGVPL